MKCFIPEISWHNRDPVLSIDFQPKFEGSDGLLRLASSGSDSHVLIWYMINDDGVARLDLAADLTRHQRAVNCVRWSPNGELLASCDDESVIFIWRQKPDSEPVNIFDRDSITDADKEIWLTLKVLRGHMDDIYDLSWSPDSIYLFSGSVDNTAMIWDVQKGKSTSIIRDHKGFVQGVAWDPLNKYLATLSTDRFLRFFDVQTKKNVQRNSKSTLPVPESSSYYQKAVRLFHDDTLQTFFRRLSFSPDGQLIVAPSGVIDIEGSSDKPLNTTYIYTRFSLKEPAIVLPSPDQFTVAIRFCPLLFDLRESKSQPIFALPYRMIFAVATKCSVYLYDTQQKLPFGLISNIHYTRLTDMTWSHDGQTLVVSSTDGYCSVIQFANGELGKVYQENTVQEILALKMFKSTDENVSKKKKKKSKKSVGRKNDEAQPKIASPTDNEKMEGHAVQEEKENDKMDVDEQHITVEEMPHIDNLPGSIRDIVPVQKIIKSSEVFSPEKVASPVTTPIQVRKIPRLPHEMTPKIRDLEKKSPEKQECSIKPDAITTPKTTINHHSKTPTPIEVRRHPRILQPALTKAKEVDEDWPKPIECSMERHVAIGNSPRTPRRIELQTISTPKSKKKLL